MGDMADYYLDLCWDWDGIESEPEGCDIWHREDKNLRVDYIEQETENAWLIKTPKYKSFWLPKSRCHLICKGKRIKIPMWIYDRLRKIKEPNGLVKG